MNSALDEAVRIAGGESKLVQKMLPHLPPGRKVERGHLYYWRKKAKSGVPGEFCRAIEIAVERQVTASMLRPDLFAMTAVAGATAPVGGEGSPPAGTGYAVI